MNASEEAKEFVEVFDGKFLENFEYIELTKINMVYAMARQGYKPKTIEPEVTCLPSGQWQMKYLAQHGISQIIGGLYDGKLIYDLAVQ